MKREFLEGLNLDKDVIDKIMDENGKDINREKQRADAEKQRADEIKSQLDSAKETLKGFEGIDVAQLQSEITKLNGDLANKEAEYKAKIADMEFNSVLDNAISGSKAKNVKAVRALLDIDSLKSSKNQTEDIKKALDTVKAENDYLFGSDEPIMNPVAPSAASGSSGKRMSLLEAMKYKNEHPEADVNSLITPAPLKEG